MSGTRTRADSRDAALGGLGSRCACLHCKGRGNKHVCYVTLANTEAPKGALIPIRSGGRSSGGRPSFGALRRGDGRGDDGGAELGVAQHVQPRAHGLPLVQSARLLRHHGPAPSLRTGIIIRRPTPQHAADHANDERSAAHSGGSRRARRRLHRRSPQSRPHCTSWRPLHIGRRDGCPSSSAGRLGLLRRVGDRGRAARADQGAARPRIRPRECRERRPRLRADRYSLGAHDPDSGCASRRGVGANGRPPRCGEQLATAALARQAPAS